MRIGELEKRSGASRHTLRYYESLGLISTGRSANNYREYSPQTLDDLSFIQQAQSMGFTLGEIGEILQARREQQMDCAQGARLVTRKLAEVEQKIAELHQLREFLHNEKLRLEASAAAQAALAKQPTR
ncbi:MAG: MerR family transcriptional regulator [Pseudomonas sp.]|uniref:MerR family transcriptional regulator n=1 Tax=Pseudomonas sp. TaxID=306 RepID=UPI003982656A